MNTKAHQKYPASVQHGKPHLPPLKTGWHRFSIGDLVKEVTRPVEMKDEEVYTLVTAKRSRGGIVKREELKGKQIAVKNQFYVRKGDFLISKRQIVHGACGFVPEELDGAIVSNEYLVLKFTDKILPDFWGYLSHTVYFQQTCFHSSIGVHVEKMLFKVEQWYRWKINIPSLEEQEKIASFLGAVDARLSQLRRKYKLLQTYKRGVMQKLFSQQIRFKQDDGSDFPDWKKVKLGDIAKIRRGASPRPISSPKWFSSTSKIGWVRISDVTKTNKHLDETEQYLSKAGVDKSRFIHSGSLIMSICATIGKPIITRIDVCIHDGFVVFEDLQENILFMYFLLSNIESGWQKYGQPGIQLNLNTDIISNESILLPCLQEQEMISGFLTSIDQQIEVLFRKIYQTEQFKKGLLQKMFV